jgi:predicted RNA-binding Zn ribbon-like protein
MTFAWTQHRFAGGALALDVANSVILRFDPTLSVDRFAVPDQLHGFSTAARTFSAERALFGELKPVEIGNRPAFLIMREAIDRYFRTRVLGEDSGLLLADVLETIAAQLRHSGKGSLENETARSALRLLEAGTVERLKICGHCGWLFIDRSKNRSRAWCDMAVCGNRAKAKRFYDRQKEKGR